jgi:hypothetical protein
MELILNTFFLKPFCLQNLEKKAFETIFFERIRFKTNKKDLDMQYAMNA